MSRASSGKPLGGCCLCRRQIAASVAALLSHPASSGPPLRRGPGTADYSLAAEAKAQAPGPREPS